jgi:acetoin utilization protein AcuC
MIPNFFFRNEMAEYDLGDDHPLRPVRLLQTVQLLRDENAVEPIIPEPASRKHLQLVHSDEYIASVIEASSPTADRGRFLRYGLGTGDVPIMPNMHDSSLWYVGGSVSAAQAVLDGEKIAFNISGGLHHAQRSLASGFCVYNDPAIIIAMLLQKFERVAYVDIDLHHGDGVQALFYDDPNVMTISIHESGETLYPGTGFTDEVGTGQPHCVNIPLEAGTTGDVWLDAFRRVVPSVLKRFDPKAIVLQMGCDPHFTDPLGHLNVTAQEWLEAVKQIKTVGLPMVVCGGGGYDLRNVARMWAAACMTLAGIEFGPELPEDRQRELRTPSYLDASLPVPRERGREYAELRIRELQERFDV